jgi:hypothetical protein
MADKFEEVSQVGSILAGIISSVAMFLPSSLGRPLRQVGMQLRRGQMIASRVKSVRRQVNRLNKTETGQQVLQGTTEAAGQVGRVATSEAARGTVAQSVNRAGGAFSVAATRTANKLYDLSGHNGAAAQGSNGANGVAAPAGPRQWVYVPPIGPGETVTIDVMVGANARNATGSHQPFRLVSRALGEENAQPVVEEGSIRLARSSPWPSVMRFILAGVVVLVAIALIWLLARTLF